MEPAAAPPNDPLPYASGPRRSAPAWRPAPGPLLRYAAFVGLAAAAVVAAIVCYRHPWVWFGSRDAYFRHRMVTLALSPHQVVYEEDPARVAVILARPADPLVRNVDDPDWRSRRDYDWFYWDAGVTGRRVARFAPPFYQPEHWLPDHGCPVFLHGRTAVGGAYRLVRVHVEPSGGRLASDPRIGLRLSTRAQRADVPFARLAPLKRRTVRSLTIPLRPEQVVRVYAGQPDPGDPARFTIRYEIDDTPGTIAGRLEDDDTVTLRVLDGPALAPSQPGPRS